MKTYEEMTHDVLQRATAGIAERNRRRKMILAIAATGLCLALILAAVGAFWKAPAGTDGPDPTISMQNPTTAPTAQPEDTEPTQQDVPAYTGQVYFLSATEEGMDLTPMQANMTFPVNSMFRVRNLKGMTESERENAIEEEEAFKAAFKEKYGNSDGGWYLTQVIPENTFSNGKLKVLRGVIVQFLSGGKASLILLNTSEIESFDTETTDMLGVHGGYGTYNRDVTVGEGESAVTIPEGCLRIYLHLSMGDRMYEIIKEAPDTPLSTISDTITVTINYKNGTKEIIVIDVTLDDDGQVYMTQRGTSAEV